jgi:hypothetical protein
VAKTLLGWVLAASVAVAAVVYLMGGEKAPVVSLLILGLAAAASTVVGAAVGAAAFRAGYARGIADACLTGAALRLLERPRAEAPRPPAPTGACHSGGRDEPAPAPDPAPGAIRR